jgi:RNA polymerase sigma-70 factor, ECF subfamily
MGVRKTTPRVAPLPFSPQADPQHHEGCPPEAPPALADADDVTRCILAQEAELRRYVRTFVPPRSRWFAEVDDLVQDTSLAALRAGILLSAGEARVIRAWYRAVVRHRFVSIMRHTYPRRADGRSGGPPEAVRLRADLPAPQPGPLDTCILHETVRQVRAALRCLSKTERAVLVSHYVRGLPLAEIARQSGRSPSAVNSMLYAARRRLREILQGSGG